MRKGYAAEYLAKQKLIKDNPENYVGKIAIGGAFDFIVVERNGRVLKVIEVKESHNKYFQYCKGQKERIIEFVNKFKIPCEIWIKRPHKPFEIQVINPSV
ncbi:MAG: hypothetical protein Q7R52_02595 [archaeon]|nr:hypothetical protein [archaeon]